MSLCKALESRGRANDGPYLVASVIDRAAECAAGSAMNYYAVISKTPRSHWNPHTEFGGSMTLYTVSAGSLAHAFYIMMADCGDETRRRPEIEDLDPSYYDIELEEVLMMVGERADWRVDKIWDRFCDLRREMDNYEIVPYSGVHI